MNINKQLLKCKSIIDSWKKRNLSMIGKITVITSLIIPNITYLASMINLDNERIKELKSKP